MNNKKEILIKAQSSSSLDGRIKENIAGQKFDFIKWIFSNLKVERGSKVLELCCGTGSQTMQFLDLIGEMGHVVAIDISDQALEKLMNNIQAKWLERITTIKSGLDDLSSALEKHRLKQSFFDLAFCAYGLYYSNDAIRILESIIQWLKPDGRIIIIGPFGPNNAPLFKLLESAGIKIPQYVRYTSKDFMYKEVIPWLSKHYEVLSIHTLVNQISWSKAENIIEYWQNTTFYDQERLFSVKNLLSKHFKKNMEFLNEKWVMMIEATNART